MSEVSEPAPRGRTTVTSRALTRVSEAVAAETFGVRSGDVRVDLSDRNGLLALVVNTPIRVAPLAGIDRSGGMRDSTIIERAARGQGSIHSSVTAITGAEIAHVTVHLTGVDIARQERVR